MPPWASPLDGSAESADSDSVEEDSGETSDDVAGSEPNYGVPVAPPRRFASARTSLGHFSRTGDTERLRSGVASYVSQGYAGASTLTRRMGRTGSTASALSRALNPESAAQALGIDLLAGRSADEIMDAVVEAVRPHDGTLDAESSREAVRTALSDLLHQYPEADLLSLTDQQREFAVERYTAEDVFRRFCLDVGKHILSRAPDKVTGLARLKQVRSYIREVVAQSFRRLREQGLSLTSRSVGGTVRQALADTFTVFESYAL
ncbi:Qat anti-phage system associated protein QatB [Mycobacterium sp. Root265]|uniref:Qat anti-phage system associated protein QatB n=1 Tax=Mycobacterium sp. Root265 TaxID=1736504 RepID=UPI003FA5EE9A